MLVGNPGSPATLGASGWSNWLRRSFLPGGRTLQVDEIMSGPEGFFSHRGGVFEPLPSASSGWHPNQMRGPALTGLLARAAERAWRAKDWLPARASFELFR